MPAAYPSPQGERVLPSFRNGEHVVAVSSPESSRASCIHVYMRWPHVRPARPATDGESGLGHVSGMDCAAALPATGLGAHPNPALSPDKPAD